MRIASRAGRRAAIVATAACALTLISAAPAWAHAVVSPPVAEAGLSEQFTLAVPTEKEGATTTKIELTVPDGIAIDSFDPSPGWTREVQATGSGEEAIIHTVTWSGGAVPTDEDATFRFLADVQDAKTYTFGVRQTYSDGSVVDWNGDESSDTPAPTISGVDSLGGGGGSSTLDIVAIALAAVALVVAAVGLLARTRTLA
jgi:uncharacterized protein YcnI